MKKRLTDEFLSTLAEQYMAANVPGTHPVAHIRARYYPGHSKRTVERWVYVARLRGYLPRHGQGRTREDERARLIRDLRRLREELDQIIASIDTPSHGA